jgi:Bacterial Ig-like domain (group 3)
VSLNPATVNAPVTFTATVTSTVIVPNGTIVNFASGLTQLGSATTTNGVATLTTSFGTAGSYTVRATTVANGYLKGSTGAITQVITN